MRTNWLPVLLGFVFISMVSIPYIYAYQNAGGAHEFAGFLLNPIDGNTYLAKMYQGWKGSWRFYLPYTVEQGNGAYLFLYYLGLGHLARISGSSSQFMFHLFRIANAIFMVASLWYFFGRIFSSQRTRLLAFGLALFGSGMGWIASALGVFSADFWVAEGYPFLSAYANPHFPLGLAIMLWLMAPLSARSVNEKSGINNKQFLLVFGSAFLLAIVMPFGAIMTAVVLSGYIVWAMLDDLRFIENRAMYIKITESNVLKSESGQKLLILILGCAPVLIYQIWVTRSDPVLAAWNAQNITITPPLWELLLAYAPIILAAVPGIYFALKSGEHKTRILVIWISLGLLLVYIPWALQRRFISGYMIPVAGLAAITLEFILARRKMLGVALLVLVLLLMLPTNFMVILGGFQAVENKVASIYLTSDEYQGLIWLESNTEDGSVILASPEMGLFIPAYTGRRVWYGHPFETPHAESMEASLVELFTGTYGDSARTMLDGSDYLFYSSREDELGRFDPGSSFELLFESGDTMIFRID